MPHATGESSTPTSSTGALAKELDASIRQVWVRVWACLWGGAGRDGHTASACLVLAMCFQPGAPSPVPQAPGQDAGPGLFPPVRVITACPLLPCRAGMADTEKVELSGGPDVGGYSVALRYPK